MATLKVDSGQGTPSSPYATWATSADDIQTAISAASSGDTILVSHTHSEQLSGDLDFEDKSLNILVVDDSDDSLVSDYGSAGNGQIDRSSAGYAIKNANDAYIYIYGLRIVTTYNYGSVRVGYSGSSDGEEHFTFENCLFMTSGGSYPVDLGYCENSRVICYNCDFDSNGNVNYKTGIRVGYGGRAFIIGGAFLDTATGTGTYVFSMGSYGGYLHVYGLDLSAMLSSRDLCYILSSSGGTIILENLKLPSGWSGDLIYSDNYEGQLVKMHASDDAHDGSSNTHHIKIWESHGRQGEVVEETTVVRDATFDGTNKFSVRLIGDDTYCVYQKPLRFELTSVFNDWSDSDYDTVEVYFTSETALNPNEFWVEVMAPGNSTSWQPGKFFTNREAITASPSDYTSGQGTWTNGKTYTYKASVTVSGCERGVGKIFACLATEAEVYVCPKVEFS